MKKMMNILNKKKHNIYKKKYTQNIMNKLIENTVKNVLKEFINEVVDEDRTEFQDGSVEVDNFDGVSKLLNFKKFKDTIYFVQIVKRDKDNPGQKSRYNACKYLKEYYFEGLDEFLNAESEIKDLCKRENARAYIYMNARSKSIIDKWTQINLSRMKKHRGMDDKFGGNAKALAAGRSFDDPSRPLCFVDVDSDDPKDIDMALAIIKYHGIQPLYTYRSLNNGIHIILPNVEDAKKLKFDIINGDLSGMSKRVQMNAKVGLEIDKPTLLYACLKPQGYDKQQARFAKWTQGKI